MFWQDALQFGFVCFCMSARFLLTDSYTKISLFESDGSRAPLAELGWISGLPSLTPSLAASPLLQPAWAPLGEFKPTLGLEETPDSIWLWLFQLFLHLLPNFLSSDSLPSRPGVWILPAALSQPARSPPALLFSQDQGSMVACGLGRQCNSGVPEPVWWRWDGR